MIAARWQTGLFAAAGLGVAALHAGMQPDLAMQALILAPLVAVLGLPHGALDLPIAEALWPLTGWRRKLGFTAAYLGLAGAVIAVWLLAPAASLALFLGYAALHFSGDWARAWPPLRWTGGAPRSARPPCCIPARSRRSSRSSPRPSAPPSSPTRPRSPAGWRWRGSCSARCCRRARAGRRRSSRGCSGAPPPPCRR